MANLKTLTFYNAIWANCTTSYRAQTPAEERASLDWRMLVNGYLDSYFYEKGAFVIDELSFGDYNDQAKIDHSVIRGTKRSDFSNEIRKNRVVF